MDCQHNLKLFGATIAIQLVVEEEEQEEKKEDDSGNSSSSSDENKNRTAVAEKVIACPRCKSMETKFCYFNNYNVNQPRHFCKGCQRYWTAGGALRNVPVGAGRRKLKPHPQIDQSNPPNCLPSPGFSDNSCLYLDPSSKIDFHQWCRTMPPPPTTTTHGAFHHVFPAKRRRSSSDGQNC